MNQQQETAHTRQHFYIGGEYAQSPSGRYLRNQMYVECLTPCTGPRQKYPVILVHGRGQSGTNWLNKPDGNPGWASWFLRHDYQVYIVDQPHVGRSPVDPTSTRKLACFPAEFLEQRFTAPAKHGGLWPQAALHTQWPGVNQTPPPIPSPCSETDKPEQTGTLGGDPIFEAYLASNLPAVEDGPEHETILRDAGVALLDKVGPAIVITHSQGGLAGWSWADARPRLVKALIQVEPKGPPFRESIFSNAYTRPFGLTSIPLGYEPATGLLDGLPSVEISDENGSTYLLQAEPPRRLQNFTSMPLLIVTGEASYHALYDHVFLKFLKQAGCTQAEHLELANVGVCGNGHLMFLEKNSDDVAAAIEQWFTKVISKNEN